MKKFKYSALVLIFFLLSFYLYENYIYYKIPYNPLVEFSTVPIGCKFDINSSKDTVSSKINHNLDDNALVFEYFRNLKLIPLKEKKHKDEIYNHEIDIYYSYVFEFGPPNHYFLIINEIWLDNLTILYISSKKPGFRRGYYKIIDSKFNYKYVNNLIDKSINKSYK
ncbi:hypothetical protein SAMN02745883_01634 [Caminicella sporogenes DSM 14501]|uniref:Uncharacterized protein n=1 Tax=Caminicella sporogenes DSM 14501 TaxID=1121266 RepID=A0A1M6QW55_9FIRM|nr:hypothetical protein [Caminicella sporogenes]RKD20889.1 hypothetical protein BET04_08630 [Caminicella sporogenes]SHK24380.1 hypothetical protein SAMN02745883_01634 [Caminicella sporogenes DSM 14501]